MCTELDQAYYKKNVSVIIDDLYYFEIQVYNPYLNDDQINNNIEITSISCRNSDNSFYKIELKKSRYQNFQNSKYKRYYNTSLALINDNKTIRINLLKKCSLNKALGIFKPIISAPIYKAFRKTLKLKLL